MDIYKYNISNENALTAKLFYDSHVLIDNIEEFVTNYISIKTSSNNYISKSAVIHPSSILGDHIFIDDEVQIGPHCYVKSNSIILKGCRLGFSVEIDRCLLFDNVKIAHNCCIGRCIIGKKSNLAFNFVIATKNLIGNTIRCSFLDKEYVSTRNHHGAVIGENLISGVNVSIMPGTTIENNVTIKNNVILTGHIGSLSMIHK